MYPQTKKMIRMAMEADATIDSVCREKIEASLSDKPEPEHATFLKQLEAAGLLSTSRQTIRNLTRRGIIKRVEIAPGLFRYRRSDLLKLGGMRNEI